MIHDLKNMVHVKKQHFFNMKDILAAEIILKIGCQFDCCC